METLTVRTGQRNQFRDITAEVASVMEASNVEGGCVVVFCPHTTAGITINENADPNVQRDMLLALDRMVPALKEFRHAEGNSPAHVKASLMGSSAIIPVVDGRLILGTWQGIYLCEFDGPRTRKVHIQVLAG